MLRQSVLFLLINANAIPDKERGVWSMAPQQISIENRHGVGIVLLSTQLDEGTPQKEVGPTYETPIEVQFTEFSSAANESCQ